MRSEIQYRRFAPELRRSGRVIALKGFSFSSPPAHQSPVGVGWWEFTGVQGPEGSFFFRLGVI